MELEKKKRHCMWMGGWVDGGGMQEQDIWGINMIEATCKQ